MNLRVSANYSDGESLSAVTGGGPRVGGGYLSFQIAVSILLCALDLFCFQATLDRFITITATMDPLIG